jgi:hypothetical protein
VKKTADERMAALETQNATILANQAKILKRQKVLLKRIDQVVVVLLKAKRGNDERDCVSDVADDDAAFSVDE